MYVGMVICDLLRINMLVVRESISGVGGCREEEKTNWLFLWILVVYNVMYMFVLWLDECCVQWILRCVLCCVVGGVSFSADANL